MDFGDNVQTLSLEKSVDDLKFDFWFQGGKVETIVYDEQQYLHKCHMPPRAKLDLHNSIISPMPGAIVSVSVKPGDFVQEGQELCIIEAMKMQNIIKSEHEGKIKAVHVKAGDSVAVDALLIVYE